MDKRWYLDVNRLARSTSWAHGAVTAYVERALAPVGVGLLLLAALVVVGWWSARRAPGHMAAIVWCAVGALVALGLCQVLVPVLAQPRPYQALHHVELLVPRAAAHSYALPNSRAAIAGAIVFGLVLARRWRLATGAFLAALLLLFGCVYVGASYPSDVAVGAGLGAAVEVALWPLGSWLLVPVVASLAEGPFDWLVVSSAPARKPTRALVVQRPSTRLPNAKAMEALRTATEAARHAPFPPAPGSTSSTRTTIIRTGVHRPSSGPDEPRE